MTARPEADSETVGEEDDTSTKMSIMNCPDISALVSKCFTQK